MADQNRKRRTIRAPKMAEISPEDKRIIRAHEVQMLREIGRLPKARSRRPDSP